MKSDAVAEAAQICASVLDVSQYAVISAERTPTIFVQKQMSQKQLKKVLALWQESQRSRRPLPGGYSVLSCRYRDQQSGYFIFRGKLRIVSQIALVLQHFLGMAIQQAASEKKLSHLRLLYEISVTLSSLQRAKEGIELSLQLMEALFGTPYIYFAISSNEPSVLADLKHSNRINVQAKPESFQVQSHLLSTKAAKQWARHFGLKGWQECEEVVGLPLKASDRELGWLLVGRQSGRLSSEEKQLLVTLSTLFATSLERLTLQEELAERSITDGLTGLYNHRFFQERLAHEFARVQRYGGVLSLAMVDIDFFKKVNDSYGHEVGDLVLHQCGLVLKETFREVDTVARYGGEEFTVIMPQTPLPGAFHACERCREEVARQTFHDRKGKSFHITISCGIAMAPLQASNKDQLIVKADQAMYKAKREGRNQTCLANGNERGKKEG